MARGALFCCSICGRTAHHAAFGVCEACYQYFKRRGAYNQAYVEQTQKELDAHFVWLEGQRVGLLLIMIRLLAHYGEERMQIILTSHKPML